MEIERTIKKNILRQEAYPIEKTECRIKLDANENPYTLPPLLKEKMFKYLETISLNRYPDPRSSKLRKRLADYLGVHDDMLLVGNGSDELIQILLIAFNSFPSGAVVIPVPTFAMYKIIALNTGHKIIEIPLNDQFHLNAEMMLDTISQNNPSLVFFSYPNNPTGNLFDRETIEKILKQSNCLVVIDEAYFNFSGETFLPDLDKWENLIILRTLSKVGFAAMRLGILIAQPSIIHELNKVRLPYNINAISQATGLFFLENKEEFLKQTRRIITGRDNLLRELEDIERIHPYPSDANFILFSCANDKNKLYRSLLEKGILIKSFQSPGILKNLMRVTVGNDEENQEFLGALRDITCK
jgi:histidinol-phosphate aminotransferase